MSCSGWEFANPLCQAKSLIGGTAKAVGNDIFKAIAKYFADVAKGAVSWLWQQLSVATSIDLTTPSIKRDLLATGAIAAVITFALFLIQVITGALRQQPGDLGRAVRGLAISFIGAAFAVAATQALLAAVDELCNGVVSFALGTDVQGLGSKLIVAQVLSSIANPAGLLLISLILIAAVVVVWVALMIRKMLIIISAVFAPIAFSGAASDISRSWVRRWIEFTMALVFSKLILIVIFMIGLSVLNGAGTDASGNKVTTSITDLVIGALTLMLAGFAPWIAIKMVHFAGDSFHTVHSQASGATSGFATATGPPRKAATAMAQPIMWSKLSSAPPGGAPSAAQSAAPAPSSPARDTNRENATASAAERTTPSVGAPAPDDKRHPTTGGAGDQTGRKPPPTPGEAPQQPKRSP